MEHIEEHKHKWYTFGCKDATYLMEKGSFVHLSFSEKVQVWFHKLICKYCRRFAIQTKKINAFFRISAKESSLMLSTQKKQSLNQLITEITKK
ncbi:MAG TPA: hypothetical protein VN026_05820 [Bacteroidia bacterium]|jgi:hypothetical protein|nr:hypothetical protein [Bacteroidia bacterium]